MNAWRFKLLLLLCGTAVLAGGASLRTQPLVNPRSNALELGSAAAKIAGIRDRAQAALAEAVASQAVAKSAALASEQVQMSAMTTASQLQDLYNRASAQADSAADASKEVVKVVDNMETTKQNTINLAGLLAVDKVKDMLMGKFDALAGWRETVLQDPHAKAVREGPKAAEPYSRALDVYYNRIQAYQAQAGSVARQSADVVADAHKIADAAQAKADAGDKIGANQDLELARAMHARGAAYAENAETLQASANEMNREVGLYYSAGQTAAERAAFMANPNGMPAMQVDPNLAYVPPPPLR